MSRDRSRSASVLFMGLVWGAPTLAAPPLLAPAAGSPISVGATPTDVAVGDVNLDGKKDLAVTSAGSDSVTILLGDGTGSFSPAPGSPFPAGHKPHLVVLADFNGDRRLDAAVAEHDSNEVRVFLGSGDGRFRAAQRPSFQALAKTPPHNHGLLAVDVNGDSLPDLVTTNHGDDSVSVVLGDGKGGFSPAAGSPFAAGRAPYPAAVGRFNEDRFADLVVPDVGAGSVGILRNDGKGQFALAPGLGARVAGRPFQLAVGDVDGDGKSDVVVAGDDSSGLTVLMGDGAGQLFPAPGSPIDAGGTIQDVALADVNGDGWLDLVAASRGTVLVLPGNGTGRFARAGASVIVAGDGIWSVTVADLNGDGKADVIVPDTLRGKIVVLLAR